MVSSDQYIPVSVEYEKLIYLYSLFYVYDILSMLYIYICYILCIICYEYICIYIYMFVVVFIFGYIDKNEYGNRWIRYNPLSPRV